MSGEMKLEPTPQGLSEPDPHTKDVVIIDQGDGEVEVVILPEDGTTKYISEDSISLDGDPDDGGKGLPGEGLAERIDMLGKPGDDKKGLG